MWNSKAKQFKNGTDHKEFTSLKLMEIVLHSHQPEACCLLPLKNVSVTFYHECEHRLHWSCIKQRLLDRPKCFITWHLVNSTFTFHLQMYSKNISRNIKSWKARIFMSCRTASLNTTWLFTVNNIHSNIFLYQMSCTYFILSALLICYRRLSRQVPSSF